MNIKIHLGILILFLQILNIYSQEVLYADIVGDSTKERITFGPCFSDDNEDSEEYQALRIFRKINNAYHLIYERDGYPSGRGSGFGDSYLEEDSLGFSIRYGYGGAGSPYDGTKESESYFIRNDSLICHSTRTYWSSLSGHYGETITNYLTNKVTKISGVDEYAPNFSEGEYVEPDTGYIFNNAKLFSVELSIEQPDTIYAFLTTKNKRVQFLYSAKDSIFTYQFISNGKVELEVIDDLKDEDTIFTVDGYYRSGGCTNFAMSDNVVEFSIGEYTYRVYYHWAVNEDDCVNSPDEAIDHPPSYGVTVNNGINQIGDIIGKKVLVGEVSGYSFFEILPHKRKK